MGSDNWMTSEGLDIDMKPFSVPADGIKVSWGNISGNFVSYESKNNVLTLELVNTKDIFKAIQSAPLEAKVIFAKEIYTISWKSYNYTIINTATGLIISIEEKQDG